MNKLRVDLENCYGIKMLEHEFSFNNHHAHLIYAANGMMKSSFARTLKGISGQCKQTAMDRVHPELPPKYVVSVDGTPIRKEQVFVADPEESGFDTSAVFTNFLADAALKSQYDAIYQQLNDYVSQIITPLKDVSISSDCDEELLKAFTEGPADNLFSILERLAVDVQAQEYVNFGFRYNYVFDKAGKVKKFVEKHSADLQDYISQYNELISTSPIFRTVEGKTFGTHQASELQKSVESGEFFGAEHQIVLFDGHVISSTEELASVFDREKERIVNDPDLKRTFDRITKDVDGNNEVRIFKEILMTNPIIALELGDYEEFRRKTWRGYLCDPKVKPQLISYFNYYRNKKTVLNQIILQARAQLPLWQEIIRLYNDRFHVPFTVDIVNQEEIILKQSAAKLKFTYFDNQGAGIEKEKEDMLNILSKGEQRAFYILQLLFELESRKASNQDNLVVFDDIADSFDYQNKYAIIEYLHDLDLTGNIYVIVLTHNFDFYRTMASRLGLRRNSWMTIKKADGSLELKPGEYQKDLFTYFVENHADNKIFVSMIPFVRNLIEYIDGKNDDYDKLTSCLHLKSDTIAVH